jgi:Putative Flp pilus-assembly TadE/G-like
MTSKRSTHAQRGQVLAIFVMSIFVLIGFVAIVIDVSWYWSNTLRVQRAADAAALAGAVDLPAKPGGAGVLTLGTGTGDAYAEAAKNGYTNGAGGVIVTPVQDPGNADQMDVSISAPVNTFFMRVFGISTITATRASKALFTLPVPMGSPENYYGVFGPVRSATTFTYGTPITTTYNNTYDLLGPGAPCPNGAANCFLGYPYHGISGQTLNDRGFWATMNTEGAANVNGDAYQPFYDTVGSTAAKTCPAAGKACYDAFNYYNYAISMPPNTTGGYVYVFDPVFCATDLSDGTGDRWFDNDTDKVSSWYELFSDPNNTPYDLTDDSLVVSSGTKFQDIAASDSKMGGPGTGNECMQKTTAYGDGRDYHDAWYLLNPSNPLTGGANGTVYRLHTTSSVPSGQSDSFSQKNADGEQSFAVFAKDTEGTCSTVSGVTTCTNEPSVYGLGAMQMFTPLSSSGGTTSSEFYLAQVPAFYAGKTLEVNLWDPGDTSPLSANVAIEIPTAAGWSPISMTWTAVKGTTNSNAVNCSQSSSGMSIVTATPTSQFNGCWLTVDVAIPGSPSPYQALQNGWWKIKYTMTGNGTSSDVTTWTAAILGNPVHLVVP